MARNLRILHVPSGEVIAQGPPGLRGILAFEGNFYIHGRCLKTRGLRSNGVPGFCIYKFFYVWCDFRATDGTVERLMAWKYWLPNPLFFFIAFKFAVPASSSTLRIESIETAER
jgi:hypothetical protein